MPIKVNHISTGEVMEFTYADSYVIFKAKELNIFDMYSITFEE